MAYLESTSFAWTLGFVQIAGLVSAWLARVSEGSRGQASCHRLFFACLGVIGLASLASVALGPRYLLVCSLTLSVMVLVAVWDVRPEARTRVV
jgi:hypothetical protein